MKKLKKIGILTLPMGVNYGGLLQAYALQEILRRMEYDVCTVDMVRTPQGWRKARLIIKHVLFSLLRIIDSKKYAFPVGKGRAERLRRRHTERFIRDNIRTTVAVHGSADAGLLAPYCFDVWVVGSDQCWRASMSPDLWMYYLGFVPEGSAAKRISYAASFGIDTWEYNPRQTVMCASLAKLFDAVSVRESSGIALCRDNLGVEAIHLIDPVMLLSSDDYMQLACNDNIAPGSSSVVSYILDPTQEKKAVLDTVAAHLRLPVRMLSVTDEHTDPEFCLKYSGTYIPVTQWLSSYAYAGFVVTDSFHGAVFSILFNKPFLVIGNKTRGMARFSSLLGTFGLEDRLVGPGAAITPQMLDNPVDYVKVNAILEQERKKSIEYLRNIIES